MFDLVNKGKVLSFFSVLVFFSIAYGHGGDEEEERSDQCSCRYTLSFNVEGRRAAQISEPTLLWIVPISDVVPSNLDEELRNQAETERVEWGEADHSHASALPANHQTGLNGDQNPPDYQELMYPSYRICSYSGVNYLGINHSVGSELSLGAPFADLAYSGILPVDPRALEPFSDIMCQAGLGFDDFIKIFGSLERRGLLTKNKALKTVDRFIKRVKKILDSGASNDIHDILRDVDPNSGWTLYKVLMFIPYTIRVRCCPKNYFDGEFYDNH